MVELADTSDLGSDDASRGGSSPFTRIIEKLAGLAQLVEHLICNQRVACSSHVAGIKRERSSVVEHHLAKVGVAGSNPVVRLRSRGGGTGRRTGLKILRDLYSRTGSTPVTGTITKDRRLLSAVFCYASLAVIASPLL